MVGFGESFRIYHLKKLTIRNRRGSLVEESRVRTWENFGYKICGSTETAKCRNLEFKLGIIAIETWKYRLRELVGSEQNCY